MPSLIVRTVILAAVTVDDDEHARSDNRRMYCALCCCVLNRCTDACLFVSRCPKTLPNPRYVFIAHIFTSTPLSLVLPLSVSVFIPVVRIVDHMLSCSHCIVQERKTATKASAKPRATKAKKDKNAPKRALSAYMFFSQDWRERIKAENPDASFG